MAQPTNPWRNLLESCNPCLESLDEFQGCLGRAEHIPNPSQKQHGVGAYGVNSLNPWKQQHSQKNSRRALRPKNPQGNPGVPKEEELGLWDFSQHPTALCLQPCTSHSRFSTAHSLSIKTWEFQGGAATALRRGHRFLQPLQQGTFPRIWLPHRDPFSVLSPLEGRWISSRLAASRQEHRAGSVCTGKRECDHIPAKPAPRSPAALESPPRLCFRSSGNIEENSTS